MLWILPTIFVLVNGSQARTYDGVSQETVSALLQAEGKTFQFITKQEHDEFAASRQPTVLPNPTRDQAKIDLNNKSKTVDERLDALIKYMELDR